MSDWSEQALHFDRYFDEADDSTRCPKCRGSGRFEHYGVCYSCKGEGVLISKRKRAWSEKDDADAWEAKRPFAEAA